MTPTFPNIQAYVWWCGDYVCDCTQARIVKVRPDSLVEEVVWNGEYYSDGEGDAYVDLEIAKKNILPGILKETGLPLFNSSQPADSASVGPICQSSIE